MTDEHKTLFGERKCTVFRCFQKRSICNIGCLNKQLRCGQNEATVQNGESLVASIGYYDNIFRYHRIIRKYLIISLGSLNIYW